MNYALYDQLGNIVSTGVCPDGQGQNMVVPGTTLYEGAAEMHDTIDPVTKKLVPGKPPEPTYRDRRHYPTVEWQLDALWHAMNQGELPKAPEFFAAIKRVKDTHPKPSGITRVEL